MTFGFGNGATLAVPQVGFSGMLNDSAIASGLTFLTGELEKRDPRLYEPLTSVTWARDIVAETGGGPVDYTSNQFVDYATAGANQWGIVNNQATDIPVLQANINKTIYPVFNWMNNVRVPFLDMERMQSVGKSLDEIYDNGLRLNYNKSLDQSVYLGFDAFDTTGLVNDPNVTSTLAANDGSGSLRTFASKTADQILVEINALIVRCWAAAEYDITGIPNQILLPPQIFASLNTRLVSTAGSISILEYLLLNNIAKTQGVDLQIVPCRQTVGQGTPLTSGGAGTNRMVAYVNRQDRVSMDLPIPLGRIMTAPEPTQVAYLSVYRAQIGVVKFKYFQCVQYLDGI